MDIYRQIDNRIVKGYVYQEEGKYEKASDCWLEAWEDLKGIYRRKGLKSLDELDFLYSWTEPFIMNFVQDLEMILGNAEGRDRTYCQKRITFCQELIDYLSPKDDTVFENCRRAIAESYERLGQRDRSIKLYREWLKEDPAWGWGQIGYSDIYHFPSKNEDMDLKKAEEILLEALELENLRDRGDLLDRLSEIYLKMGLDDKSREYKRMEKELQSSSTSKVSLRNFLKSEGIGLEDISGRQRKSEKIGRNSPCPCGSGKKYKYCCGRN